MSDKVFFDAANTGEVRTIQAVFTSLVADSFDTHPMRVKTEAEARRRGQILVKWYRALRGEKKWSLDRTLSALRKALECELDGKTYVPSDRTLYTLDECADPAAYGLFN